MAQCAEQWNKETGRNVYMPLAVMRPDLPQRSKGGEADIVAVLGIVADFDDDDAKNWKERMPIDPDYVYETSSGRFQAGCLFKDHLSVEKAKVHGKRLKVLSGCDHGTADMSHVWRIPGTLNWPNQKKISAGRTPEAQEVTVVKPWSGSLTRADQISDLLSEESAPKERLIDNDISTDIKINDFPDALKNKIIHGAPEGQRSEVFYHVVCELFKMRLSAEEICNLLAAHQNGIAQKYAIRGFAALKKQVDVCFKKVLQKEYDDLLSFSNTGDQSSHVEKGSIRSHSIKFSTIDELIKRSPPKYLIQDILPERGVCTIVGPSASYKSFIAITLAMHISQGINLGNMAVKKGEVLFMINEGQGHFAYRCKAWLNHHGIPNNDNFLISPQTINLANDREFLTQLTDIAAKHSHPALVVIDTLHKASLGTNENASEDMGLIFSRAQQISDQLSCTVLLIDHTGKDPTKGGRGSYVKFANADMVGAIKRNDKIASLAIKKQKDGEDGLTFSFECDMCFVPELGQEVPVLIYTDKKDLTQGDFIMQIVSEHSEISKEEVQEQFEQNYPDKKGNFRSTISRLLKNGRLKEGNGCLYHSIEDDFD